MKLLLSEKTSEGRSNSSQLFPFPINFVNHRHKLRQHYRGELYECDCGAPFKSKWILETHKRKHSTKENICKFCQTKYASIDSLKDHYRKKHPTTVEGNSKFSEVTRQIVSIYFNFHIFFSEGPQPKRSFHL